MPEDLGKLEVARRQFAVAIRLFFDDRDPVSVYVLAANAWEIVDVLCAGRGIGSLSKETEKHLPEGRILKRDFINQPYRNYFKHAERDPEAMVEGFSDVKNDTLLTLAAEDLLRLGESKLLECQVFQVCYLAVYPEKIAPKAKQRVESLIRWRLPELDRMSRPEQKKGRGENCWRRSMRM